MKVAINRCFGGFGLSNEAFELLLERKGIEFDRVPSKFKIRDNDYDYYVKGHVGEEEYFLWDNQYCEDRSDKDLIDVIELLGEAANGWAAEISVIDIPDDVKWHISEYDGIEHIAEDHRTWQ
jgi:hypothetical protein